ncbi:MAG: molybdenum cofactor cytidylyltransferase [Desulfobacterota bacterium]|nr:molybdenum cofactor cytidylyltransferase [Thermodesulfobacteriota bacterium]
MGVSAILLGAGRSHRMGRDKLSLPWGRETIFQRCLRTLLRSEVEEVILVVNDRTRKQIDGNLWKEKKVRVALNPHPQKGMSSSIRCGVKSVSPRSKGILIALGDQPSLKSRTVRALVEAFETKQDKIIVPIFKGRRGHPVIFPMRFKGELLRLKGDEGGRSILKRYAAEVHEVKVRSAGVLQDIDTWEDYRKKWGH